MIGRTTRSGRGRRPCLFPSCEYRFSGSIWPSRLDMQLYLWAGRQTWDDLVYLKEQLHSIKPFLFSLELQNLRSKENFVVVVVVPLIILSACHLSRTVHYPTPMNRTYLNTHPPPLPIPTPLSLTPSPSLKSSNRSSESQIPCPGRTAIQPRHIKILLCEEIPTLLRVNAR